MQVLRVAATSRATSVAAAIAWAIRQDEKVEMHAVGALAVNQATKAAAIARGYLAAEGLDLTLVPAFETASAAGDDREASELPEAVCFIIEPGPARPEELAAGVAGDADSDSSMELAVGA